SINISNAQPTGYAYKKQLTIDATQVCGTTALTDFPLLIELTGDYLKTTGNGGLIRSANGYDIVFTASDESTILYHQINHYNGTTGNYAAWVKIPSLSATVNTTIYMYYGKASVTTNPSSPDTWNGNFRTVYHFENDNFADATKNSINGS